MRNVNIAVILCEILIDPNSTAVFQICEKEKFTKFIRLKKSYAIGNFFSMIYSEIFIRFYSFVY